MDLNRLTVLSGLVTMVSIAIAIGSHNDDAMRFAIASFIFFGILLYASSRQS